MKKERFVKLPKDMKVSFSQPKHLINVCAWCPKSSYPKLLDTQEYTHGLCEKHYNMLKHKNL